MVAVRSAGLALGVIIGYCIDAAPTNRGNGGGEGWTNDEVAEESEKVRSMVTEEYLGVLVRLANERFEVNRERMRRFEEGLLGRGGVELEGGEDRNGGVEGREWEDREIRRARKQAAGLAMKKALSEIHRRTEAVKDNEEYFTELNILGD